MRARCLVLPAAAAVLALPLLLFGRGYPWPMAIVAAVAIGALAYALRRTAEHIRQALAAHRVDASDGEEADEGDEP